MMKERPPAAPDSEFSPLAAFFFLLDLQGKIDNEEYINVAIVIIEKK